jgi:hypothetical protein
MLDLRVCSPTLFAIDVTTSGFRGLEKKNRTKERLRIFAASWLVHLHTRTAVSRRGFVISRSLPHSPIVPLFPFFPVRYLTMRGPSGERCALHLVVLPINPSHLFSPSLNRFYGISHFISFLWITFIVGEWDKYSKYYCKSYLN